MNRCAVRFAQQALSECALAWRQRRLASGVVASAAQVAQRDAALWQAQQVRGEPSGAGRRELVVVGRHAGWLEGAARVGQALQAAQDESAGLESRLAALQRA